jgi:hypothetical protein
MQTLNGKLRWTINSDVLDTTATPLSIGKWTHAIGPYDGSAKRIYIDGAFADSENQTGAIVPGLLSVCFAIRPASTGYFNGSIADVRIYSAALNNLQAADLAARLKRGA